MARIHVHYVGWPQTTVIGPMVETLAHTHGEAKHQRGRMEYR
ncbi:hypothetical protein [Streptomyces sp. NPDC001876]